MEALDNHQDKWPDNKEFEDMTHVPPPPDEGKKEEEIGWQPQEEVIVQKTGGWSKARAKEIAKSLKGLRKVQKTIKNKGRVQLEIRKEKKEDKKKPEETMPIEEEDEMEKGKEEKSEKMREIEQHLKEAVTKILGPDDGEGFKKRLREHLQDDVPFSLKQRRMDEVKSGLTEAELHQRFTPEMMHYAMLSLVVEKTGSNEWASKQEVKKMADLLDLPITSMRYHIAPRKRFQKPTKTERGRITLMFGEKSGTALVCQENEEEVRTRPKKKSTTYLVRSHLLRQGTKEEAKGRKGAGGVANWHL